LGFGKALPELKEESEIVMIFPEIIIEVDPISTSLIVSFTLFRAGERAVALFCTDIAARGWKPKLSRVQILFSEGSRLPKSSLETEDSQFASKFPSTPPLLKLFLYPVWFLSKQRQQESKSIIRPHQIKTYGCFQK